MTATTTYPNSQILQMTVSDSLLYSEKQIQNLAQELYDNPVVGAVNFSVLHVSNMLKPNEHTGLNLYSQYPCTVICVDVPVLTNPHAFFYYNALAESVLAELSRKLLACQAYHLH